MSNCVRREQGVDGKEKGGIGRDEGKEWRGGRETGKEERRPCVYL